ncbi:MAG: hypothetical protein WA117_06930 [Verrucomicrobiia bacterium]
MVALLVTTYQTYRGFMFQWELGIGKDWSKSQRILLLCLADALNYFICTATGFFALWLAQRSWNQIAHINEISAGAASLLIALTIYGILGITAKLPEVMNRWTPK